MITYQIIASVFLIIVGIVIFIGMIESNKKQARKDLLNELRDNHMINNEDYIKCIKKHSL